jgi:hypothetical protein
LNERELEVDDQPEKEIVLPTGKQADGAVFVRRSTKKGD